MAEPAAVPMSATSSLGELLVADRTEVGVDLDELSRRSGFAVERIAAVESGRHDLSDDELSILLDRYATMASPRRPLNALVEIDLDAGSLRLQRTRRRRSLPAADQNLLHYLSMVHRRFDLEFGAEIPLKAVDLSLLRASLALRRDDVASRLDRMGGGIRPGLVRHRSLLVAAAATGLVVAAGAIVLIPSGRSTSTNEPTVGAVEPAIDIGTPLVIERRRADVPGATAGGATDGGAAPTVDPDIDPDPDLEPDVGDADPDVGDAAPAFVLTPRIGPAPAIERPGTVAASTRVVTTENGPRGPPPTT